MVTQIEEKIGVSNRNMYDVDMTDTIDSVKTKSSEFIKNLTNNPSEYLETNELEGRTVAYVAGGGLVTQFGDENSKIWQAMERVTAQNKGVFETAGIKFQKEALGEMGAFYRWLKKKDKLSLHCIDERLDEDKKHHEIEVHCACGACKAVQATLGQSLELLGDSVSVEEFLFDELHDAHSQEKQPLLSGTEDAHESYNIYVDYSSNYYGLKNEKKAAAKENGALAFQVSLPLKRIGEFCAENENVNQERLMETLTQWNIQIAQNIISDAHNRYVKLATESILIVDARSEDSAQDGLMSMARDFAAEIIPENRWHMIA